MKKLKDQIDRKLAEVLATDMDWWNEQKIRISRRLRKIYFNVGEIWWCQIGLNIGEEVYGKGLHLTRPVLVFRKLTKNTFMALPLTTKEKLGTWYVEVEHRGIRRWAMLNQARIIDCKRLTTKVGTLGEDKIKNIREKFIEFYSS